VIVDKNEGKDENTDDSHEAGSGSNQPQLKTFTPGPLPVIKKTCERIGLGEVLDRDLSWDEKQCKLSPGDRIEALLMNLLTDRAPLYRMPGFFEGTDTENLFGEGVSPGDLNDDCLGRALDKLEEAGPRGVLNDVLLEALSREEVETDTVHADTSSVSVKGDYSGEDGPLDITYGHGKDERPDLKQYKLGLGVNGEGVPLFGELLDGNESDKTWNKKLVEDLRAVASEETSAEGSALPFPFSVYVADSAAVTEETLEGLKKRDLDLISRLPGTYGLVDELIGRAWEGGGEGKWQEVGSLAEGGSGNGGEGNEEGEKARYQLQVFEEPLYGEDYRFLVVHSSQLEGRKKNSIERELEKSEKKLKRELDGLSGRDFACRSDAEDAWEKWVGEKEKKKVPRVSFAFTHRVVEEERRVKREGRGRPPKDWEPEYETVYKVEAELTRDEEAIRERKKRAGCFVLITSLLGEESESGGEEKGDGESKKKENWTPESVLKEYKNQYRVETKFAFIKDPKRLGRTYLKDEGRVHAFGYVLFLALLVYQLIQRRVRIALREESEPMKLAGGPTSFRPTGNRVLQRFENVGLVRVGGERVLPDNLRPPARVLDLLDMGEEIYGVSSSSNSEESAEGKEENCSA